MYAPSVPEVRGGFSFNRFTEFDASGDSFNDIRESFGFNFVTLSRTQRVSAYPDYTVSYYLGVGYTDNQPTEWFQNDFVHSILGQDEVSIGDSREQTEYVGGLSFARWFKQSKSTEAFVGAGLTTGTLYHEPYVQLGCAWHHPGAKLRLRGVARGSVPLGGDAFGDVADEVLMLQGSIAYVPNRLATPNLVLRALGNPLIELTTTWDSGLFEDRGGDPIDILFVNFAVRWATGLSFETWNDALNGTDFGPTFGFGIGFDLSTLLRLDT